MLWRYSALDSLFLFACLYWDASSQRDTEQPSSTAESMGGQKLEAKCLTEAGELSITDICMKGGISRASYYRLVAPETAYKGV